MELLYIALVFVYGIILGSFYNVVGLRVPKKESIVTPRSHCTTCDRDLTTIDLVPILSYVFLGGKCRICKSKISSIYPFMEFVTGGLFALSYYMLGFSMEFVVAILFISMLVIITVSDIAYMLIPNKILLPFAIVLFTMRVFEPLTPWWDSLLGAVVGFGILYIIAMLYKGGMGGGDVKLFFVIGLVLGTKGAILTLFLATVVGVVLGLLILKKTGNGRKTPIPFGPSIAVGAIITYFWGKQIIGWYWNLVG